GATRVFRQRFTKPSYGGVPIRRWKGGRRSIQAGFKLSQCFVELACTKKDDAQVHINGGRRRQNSDGTLQAQSGGWQIAGFAQNCSKKCMACTGRGIEANTLPQLGYGFVFEPAVPQRYTEVVMSVRRSSLERHCSL